MGEELQLDNLRPDLDLLPQIVTQVVQKVLVSKERLSAAGLTAEDTARGLLEYYRVSECCACPEECWEPLWHQIAELLCGTDTVRHFASSFLSPLHDILVANATRTGSPISRTTVRITGVPTINAAEMFLQHLREAPWLVNNTDCARSLQKAYLALPKSATTAEIARLLKLSPACC